MAGPARRAGLFIEDALVAAGNVATLQHHRCWGVFTIQLSPRLAAPGVTWTRTVRFVDPIELSWPPPWNSAFRYFPGFDSSRTDSSDASMRREYFH